MAVCAAAPNDSAGAPNAAGVAVTVAAATELAEPNVLAPNMDGAAAADVAGLLGDVARPKEKPPLVVAAAGAADAAGPASGLAGAVVGLRPPNDATPVDGEPKANSGCFAGVAVMPMMAVAAGAADVDGVLALLPNVKPAVGLMP